MNDKILSKLKPNPKLTQLLHSAKSHKTTPQEIWDQRVSWTFGQMMDSNQDITLEQVRMTATKIYGPRP